HLLHAVERDALAERGRVIRDVLAAVELDVIGRRPLAVDRVSRVAPAAGRSGARARYVAREADQIIRVARDGRQFTELPVRDRVGQLRVLRIDFDAAAAEDFLLAGHGRDREL